MPWGCLGSGIGCLGSVFCEACGCNGSEMLCLGNAMEVLLGCHRGLGVSYSWGCLGGVMKVP